MENKELIIAIETQAQDISQANFDDLQRRLHELKIIRNKIEVRKEEITKPLREALGSARDLFRPVEEKLKEVDLLIRNQLLRIEQARLKEQARVAKQVEAGKVSVEESMALVSSEAKGLFREVQRLKIISKKDIPDKYWIIDEVTLRADLIAGKKVKGATLIKDKIVISR